MSRFSRCLKGQEVWFGLLYGGQDWKTRHREQVTRLSLCLAAAAAVFFPVCERLMFASLRMATFGECACSVVDMQHPVWRLLAESILFMIWNWDICFSFFCVHVL